MMRAFYRFIRFLAIAALPLFLALPSLAQEEDLGKKAFMIGDYASAKAIWAESAALGDPEAMSNLAILYHKGLGVERDIDAAVKLYMRASTLGFASAKFNLANLYYNGEGVKRDYKQAAYWYESAAKSGHALAQVYFADMLENGRGVAKDTVAALRWYAKAAESKIPQAEYEFARHLLSGKTIASDANTAFTYLLDAAFQGHALSQALLGEAYATGIGGEKRLVEAYVWLQMAASRLEPGKEMKKVTSLLSSVERQLTPEEQGAAQSTLAGFESQIVGGPQ